MNNPELTGLIAATHTPFSDSGDVNIGVIERQAEYLSGHGVRTVFVCGSTGESHSLTLSERRAIAERWADVVRGSSLQLVVHVGANCLQDARELAAHAQSVGAAAVAALSPSYFRPGSVAALVASMAEVATAAAQTPFYYYDIPSMTGVALPMPEFLEQAADRIPTLQGLKFTNPDLMACLECRAAVGGRYRILWGVDEMLLAALSFGLTGAVGSTYNFAAPTYLRLISAFRANDLEEARAEQLRSIRMIRVLCRFGYISSAKRLMEFLGVPVGPARLPHLKLTSEQERTLLGEFEILQNEGLFE